MYSATRKRLNDLCLLKCVRVLGGWSSIPNWTTGILSMRWDVSMETPLRDTNFFFPKGVFRTCACTHAHIFTARKVYVWPSPILFCCTFQISIYCILPSSTQTKGIIHSGHHLDCINKPKTNCIVCFLEFH